MRAPGIVVVALLVACARPPSFPPPPDGVRRVAVEQPANRTGGDLVVDRPGLVERLLEEESATVPDLLGEDLRNVLRQQGFSVAEPAGDAPVLLTEISRWQHYAADYDTVTVDVTASLVDPGSGRVLWSAARPGWVVATSDAGSRRAASIAASAAIAEALLEGWRPAGAR